MLDAYIIQKIKREQEVESAREPIHVEVPHDRPAPRHDDDDEGHEPDVGDRGVTIVDYSI